MEVVVVRDSDEAAHVAADAFQWTIEAKPSAVLGIATGGTPLPLYRELGRRCERREVSLASCAAFMLDEYVGLPPDHPASYHRFIAEHFTAVVDIDPNRVFGPDGSVSDLIEEAAAFERLNATTGPIDIQLLGVGTDGHIGFNEPTSSLSSRTRLKSLTPQTRQDNARFFDGNIDAVPLHVITQGIGTILESKHIVLIATGSSKARAVKELVEGPITAMVPASALQLHPHVTIIIDEAAATELKLVDYYRSVYAAKPAWQRL